MCLYDYGFKNLSLVSVDLVVPLVSIRSKGINSFLAQF